MREISFFYLLVFVTSDMRFVSDLSQTDSAPQPFKATVQ